MLCFVYNYLHYSQLFYLQQCNAFEQCCFTKETSYNTNCVLMKGYSTLGVHYRDLQARVHKQETRNLTLHEAQPSAV